ncbi:uncharacterized protein LOC123516405 [Portunus trituberculatus]|uniref:uncharacterized protein LOC123516405 n=1 Tax=Portunus trituberculatus TaxID=210409 RepID=UPI001E1D206E|nr:uncharacterized protein LOC123516405 [Portunus trituberculatus]
MKTTKGVLMGFPLGLPVSIISQQPKVVTATRCTYRDQETRQVIIECDGPLPGHLDLQIWGTFYIRPYTPEPLRCYQCQAFGHGRSQCKNSPRCGICGSDHDTNQCLQRFKAKETVTNKCPNCGGSHHAWNKACPERRRKIQEGINTQIDWVQKHCQAPPGTFVWGTQRNADLRAPPQQLNAADFPVLQTSNHQASLPAPRAPAPASPSARPPPSQEPTITLTTTSLKSLLTDFAMSLSQILKQDIDQDKLVAAVTSAVRNHTTVPQADPQTTTPSTKPKKHTASPETTTSPTRPHRQSSNQQHHQALHNQQQRPGLRNGNGCVNRQQQDAIEPRQPQLPDTGNHHTPLEQHGSRPLRILQWNIQGAKLKLHLLQEAAKTDLVDVFLLQETLTTEDHQLRLRRYNTYSIPRIPGVTSQCLWYHLAADQSFINVMSHPLELPWNVPMVTHYAEYGP